MGRGHVFLVEDERVGGLPFSPHLSSQAARLTLLAQQMRVC